MLEPEIAENIALRTLAWIASDGERVGHFLNASGATPNDLRARAQDPDFLASVLDFLLLDDDWIVAFCDAESLPYERPREARAALVGGLPPTWT